MQGDRIRGSLFCNSRELYHTIINTNSHLWNYFTCSTHFQTRNLVAYKFWHVRWDLSASHLILFQRKKSSSSCYQLQWPLARTSKLQQQLLQLDLVWLPPTTTLVQSILANLKQAINFNLNQPRKPRSRQSSP